MIGSKVQKEWSKDYEYKTTGDHSITIPEDGDYHLILVGGGGNCAGSTNAGTSLSSCGGGGGGAYFNGVVTLTAGFYTIHVGTLATGDKDSYITNSSETKLIIAGGGGNASASNGTSATKGTGGTLDTSNATIVSQTEDSGNGNSDGTTAISNVHCSGATSKYEGYGAGNGTTSAYNGSYYYPKATGGTSGYACLTVTGIYEGGQPYAIYLDDKYEALRF